tara:strand:- start:586 stop:897 length:312 start_codon:yes stop_codon:yes gene_type:complete
MTISKNTNTVTITLSNGETLSFAPLSAWDLIATTEELGGSIETSDQFKSSMVLAWRSAKQAGFDGDFQSFMEVIPFTQVKEVVEVATPFLSADAPQVESDSTN